MIRILAMRKVMKVGEEMDTDFDVHPCVDTEYNIYCRNEGGEDDVDGIFEISLMQTYGPCGSGYCMSSYGSMHIRPHSSKLIYTHKYTGPELIEGSIVYNKKNHRLEIVHNISYKDEDEYDWYSDWDEENEVFKYSSVGCDEYYPCGGIEINFDYFEEIQRAMKARPVYILTGPSGLGKSTLAECFNRDYTVFETDSVDELPDYIIADVIVVGNRSNWTVNDIKDRVWKDKDDPDIIVVSFGKEVDA